MEKELTIDLRNQSLDHLASKIDGIERLNLENYLDNSLDLTVLNEYPQIKELCFLIREPKVTLPIPEQIAQLKHIEKIDFYKNFALDGNFVFPDVLDIKIAINDPLEDVKNIVKTFPNLKKLAIWGSSLKDKILAEEIGTLQTLESLYINNCGLARLPDTISKLSQLKELKLIWLPLVEFPEVISQLTNLESLTILSKLPSLPDSLGKLTNLKVLNLEATLNEGHDYEYSEIKFKPLPKCISQLVNLEELNLNKCGVFELSSLSSLKKLKNLGLQSATLTHCDELLQFPLLEELNLNSNYKLKNTDGLKGMNLKVLNIGDTYINSLDFITGLKNLQSLKIKGCDKIKGFTPLYTHPKLSELEASHKIMNSWEQKDKFTSIPSPETILDHLQTPDLDKVEKAIHWLGQLVDIDFDDDNPLPIYFKIEPNDAPSITKLPILDEAIKKHLQELSDETLLQIFQMSFKTVGEDNFTATILALKEIIRRKKTNTQIKLVGLFKKTYETYDAGHRYCANSVHDQIIDDFFPNFTSEALLELLKDASFDMLYSEGGDAMDGLFVAAFKNTSDRHLIDQIWTAFKKYHKMALEYIEEDYFTDLISEIYENVNEDIKIIINKDFKVEN